MIPFNKPYLTGKETDYIEKAVASGKISGDGFYSKLKETLNLKGGFNWRTAAESKKLLSSKSHKFSNKSSSFLRDKDNKNTKKSQGKNSCLKSCFFH